MNIPQLKLGNIRGCSPIFKTARVAKNIWRIINTIALIWGENMLGNLSLDIMCSSKLTVFLEQRSRKTVRFWEQIMSANKYPSLFSYQILSASCLNDSQGNALEGKLWAPPRACLCGTVLNVAPGCSYERRLVSLSVRTFYILSGAPYSTSELSHFELWLRSNG